MNMLCLFSVGDEIHGFCNGFFGRDDYESKICVLVTPRYAVFEYIEDGLYSKQGEGAILNYNEKITKEDVDDWKNSETI